MSLKGFFLLGFASQFTLFSEVRILANALSLFRSRVNVPTSVNPSPFLAIRSPPVALAKTGDAAVVSWLADIMSIHLFRGKKRQPSSSLSFVLGLKPQPRLLERVVSECHDQSLGDRSMLRTSNVSCPIWGFENRDEVLFCLKNHELMLLRRRRLHWGPATLIFVGWRVRAR